MFNCIKFDTWVFYCNFNIKNLLYCFLKFPYKNSCVKFDVFSRWNGLFIFFFKNALRSESVNATGERDMFKNAHTWSTTDVYIQLRPKVFEQTYFEYKKYNTISTRFLFIQNMFVQILLVLTLYYLFFLSNSYKSLSLCCVI